MDKRSFIAFPIVTLLIGQLSSGLSFLIFPFDPTLIEYVNPPIFPSPLVFTLVWVILYSCMGISFAYIWNERKRVNINGAITTFALLLFATILFIPVMNLSKGSPAIMTMLDINGTLASFLYGWLASSYSRKAYYWAIPLMIWMPITTILKIWLWSLN